MRLVQILRIFLENVSEPVRCKLLQLIRFEAIQELVIGRLSDFFVFLETFQSFQVIGYSVEEELYLIGKYLPNLVVRKGVDLFDSETGEFYIHLNPADLGSGSIDFQPRFG
jgi:hypothetical protein